MRLRATLAAGQRGGGGRAANERRARLAPEGGRRGRGRRSQGGPRLISPRYGASSARRRCTSTNAAGSVTDEYVERLPSS